jgi:copper(I)-binding protein
MNRRMIALLVMVALTTLALTRTSFAHEGGPHVRVAHLAPTAPAVDVFVNDKKVVENLKYKDTTAYLGLEGYSFKVVIVPAGGKITDSVSKDPYTVNFEKGDGGFYTLAAVGSLTDKTFDVIRLPADNPGKTAEKGKAQSGTLTISNAFARPTAAGGHSGSTMGSVSAAYMTIQNSADKADKLVKAETEAAGRVELHETIIKNDVASMQAVPAGIAIPAKGQAELKPGGLHIMLLDLKKDLVTGEMITLTLTFESGTVITFKVPVMSS